MQFKITLTDWEASSDQLRQIRQAVFIDEQKIPPAEEWDELDENSSHVLVLSEKRDAVGTGRLEPNGKIARLAVVAKYRGRGVGELILKRLIALARERGQRRVFLHAQTQALDFYRKFGFVCDGEVFMEAGIPHVLAHRDL